MNDGKKRKVERKEMRATERKEVRGLKGREDKEEEELERKGEGIQVSNGPDTPTRHRRISRGVVRLLPHLTPPVCQSESW